LLQAPPPALNDPVARAAAALGSDRARSAAARLRASHKGSYFAQEQARSPASPTATVGRLLRWQFDVEKQRLIRDADQMFPDGIHFSNRAAIDGDSGWSVDLLGWRTGDDEQRFGREESIASRLQFERFFPHLLMRQALASRSVERVAPSQFQFRDEAGTLIEVLLDPATGRPSRAAQIVDGKRQLELAYSDYHRRHGVMMPRRLQLFQAQRLQEDLTLGRTTIAPIARTSLTPPPGYRPKPTAGTPSARELAAGIWVFDNMPGDYHSLAIDMGDHLMLVEAPLNPGYADLQKKILAELRPSKAVRAVLVTHHHGDHNGGLARWAEAGATIIVARGAKVAIERQLRARGFAGRAMIEEIKTHHRFGSRRAVDVYAFDSLHVEAHLLVHLPDPQILFQGDLFYLPERGAVPTAFGGARELQKQIAQRGLKVRTVVGVHGRPGTIGDLRQSLRQSGRAGATRDVHLAP
ncbi:MAG: MBL fold metallo-hydrolase, partial [Pseudomonadota bacterium]|nr:MBL fold metallo-hydrolase [Pseudomonadota bacterium]